MNSYPTVTLLWGAVSSWFLKSLWTFYSTEKSINTFDTLVPSIHLYHKPEMSIPWGATVTVQCASAIIIPLQKELKKCNKYFLWVDRKLSHIAQQSLLCHICAKLPPINNANPEVLCCCCQIKVENEVYVEGVEVFRCKYIASLHIYHSNTTSICGLGWYIS